MDAVVGLVIRSQAARNCQTAKANPSTTASFSAILSPPVGMPPKRKLATLQERATGIFPLFLSIAAQTNILEGSVSRPPQSTKNLLHRRTPSRGNYALSLQQVPALIRSKPPKSLLYPPRSSSLTRRPKPISGNTNPRTDLKTSTWKSDHGMIHHPHQDQLRFSKTNARIRDAVDPSQILNSPNRI